MTGATFTFRGDTVPEELSRREGGGGGVWKKEGEAAKKKEASKGPDHGDRGCGNGGEKIRERKRSDEKDEEEEIKKESEKEGRGMKMWNQADRYGHWILGKEEQNSF